MNYRAACKEVKRVSELDPGQGRIHLADFRSIRFLPRWMAFAPILLPMRADETRREFGLISPSFLLFMKKVHLGGIPISSLIQHRAPKSRFSLIEFGWPDSFNAPTFTRHRLILFRRSLQSEPCHDPLTPILYQSSNLPFSPKCRPL